MYEAVQLKRDYCNENEKGYRQRGGAVNAYRKIVDGKKLNDIIELPKAMRAGKVEVIVFPARTEAGSLDVSESPSDELSSDALLGSLHAYADPALAALENSAWERHVKETYGRP